MADYITDVQLTDYVNFPLDTWTNDEIAKVITAATRDIDAALGNYTPDDEGNKIDKTSTALRTYQVKGLEDATCAQAEYRLIKGEEFFINYRPESQVGPDGSVEGKEPYLAPKARIELSNSGLFRLTNSRARHPLWLPTP